MLAPFDIFRVEPNGEVLWIKAAEDWKSARIAVQELMASSPNEYLIFSHRTNNRLLVKPRPATQRTTKPVIFQIAYDEVLMATRADLLKADGFTVVSVIGNEAAQTALADGLECSLFIIGHAETPKRRKEMADWLKDKFPKVPILALNPPDQQELKPADYNLVLNDPEEWLFVVKASTS